MPDILQQIVKTTRQALPSRKAAMPESDLRNLPGYTEKRRGFADALKSGRLAIIAEHKRRSPSKGIIREDVTLPTMIDAYVHGGAAAVSVLTETEYFGGSIADLVAARECCRLPLLRKDFIVDPYQIVEARAHGADAILLIAAALERRELAELHEAATREGLDVLVEVHASQELDDVDLDTMTLIGVNNRDLRTFDVDITTSGRVFPLLPPGTVRVSESGYNDVPDIRRAVEMGADAILVGERVMRDRHPQNVIETWLREAAAADKAA